MTRRRVTLTDVAQRAGLSVTAASLVLNRQPGTRLSAEAHQRVLAAAAELGYRPNMAARSLRTQKTTTLAFISDIIATTRFAGDMIRGALDAAREHGHVLLIAETQGDPEVERSSIEAMLDRQVDGFVYAAMATRRLAVPRAVLSQPSVLLNATSPRGPVAVLPDDEGAAFEVTTALLDHGHSKIALIGRNAGKERDPEESLAATPRLRGVRRALAVRGTRLLASEQTPDWQPEHGYEAARSLLARRPPTGIVCMNDRLAFGAYQAIAEAGLGIPGDISIVSFDDDPIAAWLRPGLCTAGLPHEQMGRLAVELLLDGDLRGGPRLVPMPMRQRSSIAAPRP
ncbi:MAG: LacI family DNA-binding transcriptional regulator [Trebonia sp.]